MSNMIKDALKEYVAGLNRIIGDKLKYIILYGSYARGEESKNGEISDIDILIVVDEIKIKNLEKNEMNEWMNPDWEAVMTNYVCMCVWIFLAFSFQYI